MLVRNLNKVFNLVCNDKLIMNLEQYAKRLSPPIVIDAIQWAQKQVGIREARLHQYLYSGKIPFSPGYYDYRAYFVTQALADEELLKRFRYSEVLAPGYGIGVDERCIEYPWLLTHLGNELGVLLDAGSALNHRFILEHSALQNRQIHILTLGPEENCFWQKGVSYLFNDLRDIPVCDAYYDTIACISTLEHVGCDNTLFTNNQVHNEHSSQDFILAMQELARVLKPGGRLLLTVPFGVYRHQGFQQVFNRELLSRAIAAFGEAAEVNETFYRYTANGWNLAKAEECTECEYVEWIAKAWQSDQWPDPIPVEADMAAAARAVACVEFVKS